MTQGGLKKGDALERGFSPEVITTLGVMALPGVGPFTVRTLGDPDNIQDLFVQEDLSTFTAKLNAAGAKFSPDVALISDWATLRERVWKSGVAQAADLVTKKIRCITPSSSLYPARLHDLGRKKPKWLYLRGDATLLGSPSIAVVGTRTPSVTGDFLTKMAVSVCRDLAAPVVSGLAKGIDTIAHEWSLCVGTPTISVLGTGILVPYPARNASLADEIVNSGGLLVSEYLPYQGPTAESFVWRNRLQACLATSVVASEWKRSSGTAHTVRFANELGRSSISLSLNGASNDIDAGRGEHHFTIPTQMPHFIQALAEGLKQSQESNASDYISENAQKQELIKPDQQTDFWTAERHSSLF